MPPVMTEIAGGILINHTIMKDIRWLPVILCSITCIISVHAQKHDRYWPIGHNYSESETKPLFFYIKFDYNGGYDIEVPPQPDSSNSKLLNFTFAPGTTSYSDKEGNLKFLSNSLRIFDATLKVMENGDTINPGIYWKPSPFRAYYLPRGVRALPAPGDEDHFAYLIHQAKDTCKKCPSGFIKLTPLYYTKIDLQANGGLGTVVEKNKIIEKAKGAPYSVTKHANGRDWWILLPEQGINHYRRYLLTPQGIEGPWIQEIGPNQMEVVWKPLSATFSPAGDKFVFGYGNQAVFLFDFDRCTGLLSNCRELLLTDYQDLDSGKYGAGTCFSSSGRYCYLTSGLRIYQMDTEQEPLSIDTIVALNWPVFLCEKDSLESKYNGFQHWLQQLGPDGNIYISHANEGYCLSRIDNADKKYDGTENGPRLTSVDVPSHYAESLPCYPNYRLGALAGPCDTLASVRADKPPAASLQVYPNPSAGDIVTEITLPDYGLAHATELRVFDASGKEVYNWRYPAYSYLHVIPTGRLSAGIYTAALMYKGSPVQYVKFSVVR